MDTKVKILGRHVQKHDIEANWIKAGNAEKPFVPLKAEIIVYDEYDSGNNKVADSVRYKMGNGIDNINDLPFIDLTTDILSDAEIDALLEEIPDLESTFPLHVGNALNSVEQSNSKAVSENAIAFGENTFAGLKGFDIVAWDKDNSTYTLSSALPARITVGAVFSANIKTNYYNASSITAISDDRLTISVDNYIDVQAAVDADGPETKKNIWFIDYPDAGDIDLGMDAVSMGDGAKALQTGALAAGRDVKAVGKYSTALGRDTTAWYAGLATGYKSEATGLYSTAIGYRATAKGENSIALGDRVVASGNSQVVVGKSNVEDEDAVFIVGNGFSSPSTALSVSKDGVTKAINIETTKNITATGSISSTNGSISSAGKIIAGTTLEAGAGIKTGASSDFGGSIRINKGSLDVKTGSISTGASGGITTGTNGVTTTGKISTTANIAADGSITAGGPITASGDINARTKVNTGNITASADLELNARGGTHKVVVGNDGSFKHNGKDIATQEYVNSATITLKNELLNSASESITTKIGSFQSIKIGDTTLDETQIKKILKFIEYVEV